MRVGLMAAVAACALSAPAVSHAEIIHAQYSSTEVYVGDDPTSDVIGISLFWDTDARPFDVVRGQSFYAGMSNAIVTLNGVAQVFSPSSYYLDVNLNNQPYMAIESYTGGGFYLALALNSLDPNKPSRLPGVGNERDSVSQFRRDGVLYYSGGTISLSAASVVPEPATWSLMILGFSAIGFLMRRRTTLQTSFGRT